ncbi:MAG: hypothetical protein GKR98_09435 [Boseongicola sp.]|nr:MAG: hypothetical protein GKR98_09435 [Boseongicola sp.]
MSSYNRRAFCLTALAALTGCGFQPVYGPGGDANGLRGRINFADPADEEGFELVARLEDRLGQPANADLDLYAELFVTEEAVGFLSDGTISRYNVLGRVNWTLTGNAGQALAGDGRLFTSYSATSTTVATIVAQRDARRRLAVILADGIVADILTAADTL